MQNMCEPSGAPRPDGQRPDRRKEIRAPLNTPVWLRVLTYSSPVIEGRIVNISKHGMKLHLPQRLAPGVAVQLRMGGKIVLAEVRHCSAIGDEFQAGVEIQDVFPIPGKIQTPLDR